MISTALATTSLPSLPAAGGPDGYQTPTPAIFEQFIIEIGALRISNQMLWAAIITGVLCLVMVRIASRASVVPSKGQWLFEGFYNFPRNTIGRDMIGTKEFRRFIPLLVSLFAMILFFNLAGIFPLSMNPVTGKIGFPIALTIVVYVVYHWIGFQKHGFAGYFKHMLPAGLPGWIKPVILVLELITYFITRPLTLALRLFGNMFAGHMLIYLFVTAAFYFLMYGDGILLRAMAVPSFLMAAIMVVFEALVQFLQAFVFTLLTASYIAGALADDH